jgi:7-carboxy-7-deazaguanine synthase
MLTVIETFYSIEGEGPFIGIPTFFIRLSGCNLRCSWTPIGSTKILMSNQELKEAKDIRVGDSVMGFERDHFKISRVVNTIKTRTEVIRLTMESGRTITVTPEHPFYYEGSRSMRADRMIGRAIRILGRGKVNPEQKLKSGYDRVIKIETAGTADITHFETETHNYIAEGYLSHNCDTKYSYSGGEKRTVDSLVEEASSYGTKFVCITGGEPLLQKEVYPLMNKLLDREFKVILETSGSISVEDVPTDDNMIVSMDIKTPSSNMVEHNIYDNIELLAAKDYLKFVISDEKDYSFSKSIIEKYPFEGEIIFQPEGGKNLKELTEKVLKERLNVRVLPQLHKFIWGEKRGV